MIIVMKFANELIFLSLIPGHTACWCPMLFSFRLFSYLGIFRSSFLFLCHWISFVLFLYDQNICTILLDPLFVTIGEFQAWD